MSMHTPAHKYVDPEEAQAQAQDNPKADQMADFDLNDDTPLALPLGKCDGETCEACQ